MRNETENGQRYVPMRTCAGCRQKKEKNCLIRIVRGENGQIAVDTSAVRNGRGAYLCRQRSCLEKAYRKKSLQRSLKTAVPEEICGNLS